MAERGGLTNKQRNLGIRVKVKDLIILSNVLSEVDRDEAEERVFLRLEALIDRVSKFSDLAD